MVRQATVRAGDGATRQTTNAVIWLACRARQGPPLPFGGRASQRSPGKSTLVSGLPKDETTRKTEEGGKRAERFSSLEDKGEVKKGAMDAGPLGTKGATRRAQAFRP
jgi:hypothetical protein